MHAKLSTIPAAMIIFICRTFRDDFRNGNRNRGILFLRRIDAPSPLSPSSQQSFAASAA
jgi:hypothetical protein